MNGYGLNKTLSDAAKESNPTIKTDSSAFKMSEHEAVNHPDHYNKLGVECIEVVRHFNFNRGNAIKYIWRAGHKGSTVEDLQKAIWYLNDEIKRLESEQSP